MRKDAKTDFPQPIGELMLAVGARQVLERTGNPVHPEHAARLRNPRLVLFLLQNPLTGPFQPLLFSADMIKVRSR